MKLIFTLALMFDAAPEGAGGFTPEQKSHLGESIGKLQTALETKSKDIVAAALKEHAAPVNEAIEKFTNWQTKKDETDLLNQKALDDVLIKVKEMGNFSLKKDVFEAKSLQMAMAEAMADPENIAGLEKVARGKGDKYRMMLKGPIDLSAKPQHIYNPNMLHKMEGGGYRETKTVGDFSAANNLTGQGMVDYGSRQAILPAQKVNARDLVPTVHSETGTYVYFRESAGEGSISQQTAPGAAKTQIDFDFARIETVQNYIAGWTRFPKQFMRTLPFLQNTLPRLLQREFFKVENRRFWDIMTQAYAAGGTASGSTETDDIKQIIDAIAALYDADFVASYGIMRWKELARINKYLLTNGNYLGAGGVIGRPDGSITVMGTPVLPVTWIPSFDQFLTWDSDFVERIEVESLAIEFFEQDGDNVQKNNVTARIECFEDFNAMQPKAIVKEDMGNSSTS